MSARWRPLLVSVQAGDPEAERFCAALAELAKRCGCSAIQVTPMVSDDPPGPVAALPEKARPT
jgi:hypothetical protein